MYKNIVPEWFKKTSVYQINPRTFSKEGTIKSVIKELPLLKELGFGIIYLCPIFKADDSTDKTYWSTRQKASNTENPKSPYRMVNYFEIDEEYGSMADLKAFVSECHRLELKAILDLVYLHMGPNADILKAHSEFAKRKEDGSLDLNNWNFAVLNYENEGLREYLYSNMTYYVGEIGVDGFRCDVGDGVPLDFWAEGKRRIKAIKPDAVMINEGEKSEYLSVFDSNYGFTWHTHIFSVITGEKPADAIRSEHERVCAEYPKGGLVLRDMDNHDTVTDWPDRVENLAGHDGMEMILALNFMIDGVPMVYCGNELADSAKLSMFANRFHMGAFEVTDRKAQGTHVTRRIEVIKTLNTLRKTVSALSAGETVWLDTNHPESILAFKRCSNTDSVVFLCNFGKTAQMVALPDSIGNTLVSNKLSVDATAVTLEPYGYIAYMTLN